MTPGVTLGRRGLLLAGGASVLAVGCGRQDEPAVEKPPARRSQRFPYGTGPAQFAELRMPSGTPRATVVLLHGGAWLGQYTLDQMEPLGRALNEEGFATWNVEYRGLGAGGGIPPTLDDVAAALDRLSGTGLPSGIASDVVAVGHSAGGHLATWAASRTARTPGGASALRLRGVVSLAGILDLSRGAQDPDVGQIVAAFAGGGPADVPARYALADPTLLLPASCPVWAVAAENDTLVPLVQAEGYVARNRDAGGTATLVRVPGDHNSVIDPQADSYPTILDLVRKATA